MRVAALVCSAGVLLLPATAVAQTESSLLYRNTEYHFAVIFPGAPMATDITYMTREGAVPAKQFFVSQGEDRYSVTLVKLPMAEAVDEDIVEHTAEQLRQRGEVRFQYAYGYDPGVPGRQLNILEPNGKQLRASVYMWDQQLFITEASATVGDQAAIQFDESVMLLDAEGNELNTARRRGAASRRR